MRISEIIDEFSVSESAVRRMIRDGDFGEVSEATAVGARQPALLVHRSAVEAAGLRQRTRQATGSLEGAIVGLSVVQQETMAALVAAIQAQATAELRIAEALDGVSHELGRQMPSIRPFIRRLVANVVRLPRRRSRVTGRTGSGR